MNETHQQIVNVATEAIEKILTLAETTQTPSTETPNREAEERQFSEAVIDKAVDRIILEDGSQIKDDIVERVADTIDNSDISDLVYDRLDVDDIVSSVAERVDDDEIAEKLADKIVESDEVDFYKKLVEALIQKIAKTEEAKA